MILKKDYYIIEAVPGSDPMTVLEWLINLMTDSEWILSPSNLSAKNKNGEIRWSIFFKKKYLQSKI